MKQSPEYTLPEQTEILIRNGRYKDAFTLLRRRLIETPVAGQLNLLGQTENTYRYLLHYYAQGASDPGRESVLAGIRTDIRAIADNIEKEQSAAESPELYYSTLRMQRLKHADAAETIKSLAEEKAMLQLAESAGVFPEKEEYRLEEEEGKLFDTLWISDTLSSDTYRSVSAAISSGALTESSAATAISAIGLGVMKHYNRDAIMTLCDASESNAATVSARGMTHLLFALHKWSKRVSDDIKLTQRLEALFDTDRSFKRFSTALITAIRTRDTSRVSRKMERDVIPGLMQLGPDILKRLKDASKDSSFADLEANPEWEEILGKSGLEDKLRDLSEMQSDGADVMMVAFSNMKGYPFFRTLRNWFLPFSIRHSSMNFLGDADREDVGKAIDMNFMMCDSDKYSFAFALTGMPEAQRKMVIGQIRNQMEQVGEQMKEIAGMKEGSAFETSMVHYMRNLYRFYKLHPKRKEFADPFEPALDITSLPAIGEKLNSSVELLRDISDFYFRRRYYAEAHPLLERLSELSPEMPHIWEKIGFCIEKSNSNDDASEGSRLAIEAYMKAQLFNPDSRWISRRLGMCYRQTGDYRNAAECIRGAMPDDGSYDRTLTLLLADTLADGGKWEQALKELYRVDYETPGDSTVLRRMAKCALLSGKSDKAFEWMSAIPAIDLSEDDHRLKGHIELIRGNISDAIRNYRLTVRPNDEKRQWKTRILADSDMLKSIGVGSGDLQLLMEAIAYEMEP